MMVSLVCLVHCVALPLMVSLLPVLGIAAGEWPLLEWFTVLTAAAAGGWAISKGYFRFHRQKGIVLAFALGLLLVVVANLLGHGVAEMSLKGAGAVLLVWAHLRNRAESRRCCAPAVA